MKESILYKILENIFVKPYFCSKLHSFFKEIGSYLKKSVVYSSFMKYLNKKPYFLNSASYKNFRKFISIIDKLMDKLNKFFGNLIKESYTYKNIQKLNSLKMDRKLLLLAIAVISLNVGYTLGGIVFNTKNPVIGLLLSALFLGLYVCSVYQNTYKESFIYKFIKYLF